MIINISLISKLVWKCPTNKIFKLLCQRNIFLGQKVKTQNSQPSAPPPASPSGEVNGKTASEATNGGGNQTENDQKQTGQQSGMEVWKRILSYTQKDKSLPHTLPTIHFSRSEKKSPKDGGNSTKI